MYSQERETIQKKISSGALDEIFTRLYGDEDPTDQRERYRTLIHEFSRLFPETREISLFSAAGRTELMGNHTDHNLGKVCAASIQLDNLAAAAPRRDNHVIFHSKGFSPVEIDLTDLEPQPEETGRSEALVRGIACRLKEWGYEVGGFEAYADSRVLSGSGLSSSAALEILLGAILNGLYNKNSITTTELALAGQYGENRHFGKPCGLMDQLACAQGGIIEIDFKNPRQPQIKPVSYNFLSQGYQLTVVDTGGDHADLTPDYAAVPQEMKALAQELGADVLRSASKQKLLTHLSALRRKRGDRAVLRGLHYFDENDRVERAISFLKEDNIDEYIHLVQESGLSSFRYLQNVYSPSHADQQGITLGLYLTQDFLRSAGQGCCRVHGGGFAGTIQAYIPSAKGEEYRQTMEKFFGRGCVTPLRIRQEPAGELKLP